LDLTLFRIGIPLESAKMGYHALVGDAAEVLEQIAVKPEIRTKPFDFAQGLRQSRNV